MKAYQTSQKIPCTTYLFIWITEECDCVIPLNNDMKKNGTSCKEGKMIIEDLCELLCTVQSTKAKSGL